MNWKMNYWTLLFALAAVVLLYKQFAVGEKMAPTTIENNLPSIAFAACPTNTIPNDTGLVRAARYKSEWADNQPIGPTEKICNANVRTFLLRKCELQQMLLYTGAKDSVYAVLGIIPGNPMISGQKDTIDLMFQVYRNASSSQFYDFSSPCPPVCGLSDNPLAQ